MSIHQSRTCSLLRRIRVASLVFLMGGTVAGQSRTGVLAGGDLNWALLPSGAHTAGSGFHGGAFGMVDTSALFTLRWEALFVSRTFSGALSRYDLDKAHHWTRIDQVEVPLLCSYLVSRKMGLLFGGSAALTLGAHENGVVAPVGSRTLLLTVLAGITYRFGARWEVNARYAHPVNSMAWGLQPRTVQLGCGYAFGPGRASAARPPAAVPLHRADSLPDPDAYWRMRREQRDDQRKQNEARRRERDRLFQERQTRNRARADSINHWSVPAHFILEAAGGPLMPADFSFPVRDQTITAHVDRLGSALRFGFVDWSASVGKRAHVGFGIRIGYARYSNASVHSSTSGNVSVSNYSGWWREFDGTATLEQRSIGLQVLVGSHLSERGLLLCGAEMRASQSSIVESGEMVYSYMVGPDPDHPYGRIMTAPAEHYRYDRQPTQISPFQLALQLGYQYRIGRRLLAGLEGEICAFRMSRATDKNGRLLARGGMVAGLLFSVALELDHSRAAEGPPPALNRADR